MTNIEKQIEQTQGHYIRLSLKGLALLSDPQLLANPHLLDYDRVLAEPLMKYFIALRRTRSRDQRVSIDAQAEVERMALEIQPLLELVNRMHAVDVGPRQIANRKFANRLVSLVGQMYEDRKTLRDATTLFKGKDKQKYSSYEDLRNADRLYMETMFPKKTSHLGLDFLIKK